ncbi:hypothetical protein ABZ484_01540 [Streptomyces sp. NPDC006393]|uniref:hypothetical protein n=1 Tax=Streptomyces sp. NPDC006393 TaxID=3156763 RepID=UPI0033FA78E9
MLGARLGQEVGLGNLQRDGQGAVQVTAADQTDRRRCLLDSVGVALAGGLPGDTQPLTDHRPRVPGGAHHPYDLVDGGVRVGGHVLAHRDDGVQRGEFVAVLRTGVGRFDELLHGGFFARATTVDCDQDRDSS